MKVKELFGVLVNTEDVRLYNSDGIFVWEGEFKEIPPIYFESVIDEMYSTRTVDKGILLIFNLQ